MPDKAKDLWEYYGEETPYFAVSTFDKFKNENLDQDLLAEFFASGEEYIERIWAEIKRSFEDNFHPQTALDFGCGVGRITIPLAKRVKIVTGIDISQKMLVEAEQNHKKLGLDNVSFVLSDEDLAKINEKYDFVHSFIVLQHIKPALGEKIFRKLIDLLNEGGIAVLQMTYNHPGSKLSKFRFNLYLRFPLLYSIRNKLLKKKTEPLMPVYIYELNRIFKILQDKQCHRCLVRFSEHGHEGVLLFFQKNPEDIF